MDSWVTNLENFPTPVLVSGVARQVVHVPQTLNRFWSQKIVRIGRFNNHVIITVILLGLGRITVTSILC